MHIQKIRAKIAQALDVPPEALGEQVIVSTVGFYDTTVDGCTGVIDYSPSHVILDCGTRRVLIEGNDLRISVFSMSRVRVCGKIESISNGEVTK